jgi:glycosyltransferase involved in cell wall biosynthesis
MRVLHVIPAIAKSYGGPSKVVIDTCRALRNAGVDAEIATTSADHHKDIEIPNEMPINIEGVPVYFFPRLMKWSYKPSWGLTRWLNQNIARYDLLHAHALFSYSTAAAAALARKHRVPYIILPHGMLGPWPIQQNGHLKRIYLNLIESRNLKRAAGVHFTAEDELRKSAAVGTSNFVLPYIVDLPNGRNGHRPSANSSKLRILYLSRFDPKKGIDLLAKALGRLIEEGVHFELIMAGRGERQYEEQVKAMLRESGVLPFTTFPGFVQGEEKAKIIASADLFVLPSYDENFGIAITEVMANGVPVIITDGIDIHEEIKSARAGLVITPTVEALHIALRKLLEDESLRSEMGKRGRALVETKFSVAATTRETINVYEDILRNSRQSCAWRNDIR